MNFPKKKNRKYWILGALVFILLIVGVVNLAGFSPWSYWWEDDEEVTTPKLVSTFKLLDYRTGEDISAWVEVSVWTEDPDDLPFSVVQDPYTLTNFDEEVSSDDAGGVSIDLRSYTHVWLEIDPDFECDYGGMNAVAALGDGITVSRDFRHIFGGVNRDYTVYLYHLPSNMSVTVRDRVTNDEWGITYSGQPELGNQTNDGHFVTEIDMLWDSTHGLHAGNAGGDEWEVDDDEFDAMTPAEHYWLRDQKNFRTIAPLYSLNDDTGKQYDNELELVTNCFAVQYHMNDSISEVATNDNWLNFTLSPRDYNDIPAEVVFDNTNVYVIFYEPITCYDHKYSFEFDVEFGRTLNCTYVTLGRIFTPYDDDNLGAYERFNRASLWEPRIAT